jgi:NhaP-type Na+/H+ or K+/H+ antiporter
VFVIAFTGVRGAVSLAAALALPFALPNGDRFPYRDLILFVSFGVIFITLVGLGSPAAGGAMARVAQPAAPNTSPNTRPKSRPGARRSNAR